MSTSIGSPGGSTSPVGPSSDTSVGDLVKAMSADLSRLVRAEMQLAQVELGSKAKTAGVGTLIGKKKVNEAAPAVPERPWPA